MTDTIELLETIGTSASLRHASAKELAAILTKAEASHSLSLAAATGDRTHLSQEFGRINLDPPQVIQI